MWSQCVQIAPRVREPASQAQLHAHRTSNTWGICLMDSLDSSHCVGGCWVCTNTPWLTDAWLLPLCRNVQSDLSVIIDWQFQWSVCLHICVGMPLCVEVEWQFGSTSVMVGMWWLCCDVSVWDEKLLRLLEEYQISVYLCQDCYRHSHSPATNSRAGI